MNREVSMRTLLGILLLAAVGAAQSFDQLMPDSTVVYVSVENFSRTKERFDQGPLGAFWRDEAMQAFTAKPREEWNKKMAEIKAKDGITPEDVISVVTGQAAIALYPIEGKSDPAVLILADIGDHEEKLRELVRDTEKQLIESQGYRRDEEEFRGTTIVSYLKEAEEEGAEPERAAWLLDGKTFALAEDTETLKQMLVRKEAGGEGTLAARELYQRTRGRVGARGGEVFMYVDAPNIWKVAQAAGDVDEEAMRILDVLGIMSIESLGVQMALEPTAVSARIFLAVKGPKTGILKLFDAKNTALNPPAFAPSDAVTAGAFALDIPAIWEEFRKALDKFQEGLTMQLDGFLQMMQQQTGVDIVGDILGTLGTELTFQMRAPEQMPGADESTPTSIPGSFPHVTITMQVKDRERLEGAIDKLMAMAGPAVATQDYLGVKLRAIQTPMGVTPGLAVLPDRLVFSMATEDLKDAVTRYGKSVKGLLDREDIAAALGTLPPDRIYVSVEDTAKSLRLGMLNSLIAGAQMGGMRFLDPELFPSEEMLTKYLGISTAALVNEEDGLTYVSTLHLRGQ